MILAVQSWALSKITVVNNLSHTTNYCDFYHGTSVSLQPQQTLTKSKASCDCVSDNELQSTNQNTRTWALTLIKCISCEAHPHCRYVKIWHNYTEKGTDSCSDIWCNLHGMHPALSSQWTDFLVSWARGALKWLMAVKIAATEWVLNFCVHVSLIIVTSLTLFSLEGVQQL